MQPDSNRSFRQVFYLNILEDVKVLVKVQFKSYENVLEQFGKAVNLIRLVLANYAHYCISLRAEYSLKCFLKNVLSLSSNVEIIHFLFVLSMLNTDR